MMDLANSVTAKRRREEHHWWITLVSFSERGYVQIMLLFNQRDLKRFFITTKTRKKLKILTMFKDCLRFQ